MYIKSPPYHKQTTKMPAQLHGAKKDGVSLNTDSILAHARGTPEPTFAAVSAALASASSASAFRSSPCNRSCSAAACARAAAKACCSPATPCDRSSTWLRSAASCDSREATAAPLDERTAARSSVSLQAARGTGTQRSHDVTMTSGTRAVRCNSQ